MKIKQFILLFSIFSLLLCVSCHHCKQKEYPFQSFSQQDLKIHPYSGTETLVYKDSLGDSIVFIGRGRETIQSKHFSNDPNGDEAAKYNCFGDYYFWEFNTTTFGPPTEKYLEINLLFSNSFLMGSIEKQIEFVISSRSPEIKYYHDIFRFDEDSILNSQSFPNDRVSEYLDSIKFGNRFFKKVYKLECQNGKYLYYSLKDGLIGFTSNANISFILSNVK